GSAAIEVSVARRFYWSLRREAWEFRVLALAPLAVAALVLLSFLFSLPHLPPTVNGLSSLDPAKQVEVLQKPYQFAELALMATFLVVAVVYCLDALHGERRDRSILFWKSLPVSDLITVLVKASMPTLFLPLLTFAITLLTQWTMLLLSAI